MIYLLQNYIPRGRESPYLRLNLDLRCLTFLSRTSQGGGGRRISHLGGQSGLISFSISIAANSNNNNIIETRHSTKYPPLHTL